MDPVLVEVTRGGRVESAHRAAAIVVDASGGVVFTAGDVDQAVFPRSAIKALLALPMVESGAAARLGLSDAEIALACSSHSGEEDHVATAASMLAKAGRDVSVLECGTHWPSYDAAARALAAAGKLPSALHNNCSGKHSGFICLACDRGDDPAGYVAFARFGTGQGLAPDRAAAAKRIRQAVAAQPRMVAGTNRFDTRIIAALGERVFVKGGAEGVHCGAIPELGIGIAVKCDDGAGRAADIVTAALIARLLPNNGQVDPVVAQIARPTLTNWNGIEVGTMRPAGPLAQG